MTTRFSITRIERSRSPSTARRIVRAAPSVGAALASSSPSLRKRCANSSPIEQVSRDGAPEKTGLLQVELVGRLPVRRSSGQPALRLQGLLDAVRLTERLYVVRITSTPAPSALHRRAPRTRPPTAAAARSRAAPRRPPARPARSSARRHRRPPSRAPLSECPAQAT